MLTSERIIFIIIIVITIIIIVVIINIIIITIGIIIIIIVLVFVIIIISPNFIPKQDCDLLLNSRCTASQYCIYYILLLNNINIIT